jgi:hypothetical protein
LKNNAPITKSNAYSEANLQKYLEIALDNNCLEISAATEGNRNIIVHGNLYALGQIYQGIQELGFTPTINEFYIKSKVRSAIDNLSVPLPESEISSLLARSFLEDRKNSTDLSIIQEKINKEILKPKMMFRKSELF